MFIPQPQVPDPVNALNVRITPMAWVVRTATEPYALNGQVQEALRQATGLPVSTSGRWTRWWCGRRRASGSTCG
jgi:hypothetical protein